MTLFVENLIDTEDSLDGRTAYLVDGADAILLHGVGVSHSDVWTVRKGQARWVRARPEVLLYLP